MTTLPSPETLHRWAAELIPAGIAAGVAIGLALLVHLGLFTLLRRITRLSSVETDGVVVERLYQPLRWSLVAIALSLASEGQPVLSRIWHAVDRFVVPALLGWVIYAIMKAFAAALEIRAEGHPDDISARSRRTRIALLSRTAGIVIVFVTVALMLLSIPGVRNVGATLIASAGLATLAIGAAAQPALRSLIAGLQMALTEPIRIDDFIVIDGESGRVEDIRMSYVVIRTADERRIIVPTAKFLDSSFQNWTRVGSGITGSVVIVILPGHPIAPIRAAYEQALARQPQWDHRTGVLQVADARVDAVELKLVMSAKDPAQLGPLRLAMREAVLEWLRCEMPDALKREG